MSNYARAPVTFVRGEGCELIDDRGVRYLDFVAGIAVCALGHAHPAIAEAVSEQARTLVHCSNLYGFEPAGMLAFELSRHSGFGKVFFCNSGAEANEAAIKFARKRAFRDGDPQRNVILTCEGGFHGRTLGSLAATPNAAYHEGFEPLPRGFRHTPFNDAEALNRTLTEDVAAFLVEPVQGEGGVTPAGPAFLQAARELCTERGALLIFDEIQCGMGRMGTLFAFESFGVRPDAITLAKGLANGLPIGALLVDDRFADVLRPGDHGTTFGGSPVPCAAALAHLRVREGLNLDANVLAVSEVIFEAAEHLALDFPHVYASPRGRGLMIGIPVRDPYTAKGIAEAARDGERLLIATAGGNTIRLIPPLILSREQARDGMERLERATVAYLAATTL
jgi:predicted acetylornithine/succinylornithine family transaminase